MNGGGDPTQPEQPDSFSKGSGVACMASKLESSGNEVVCEDQSHLRVPGDERGGTPASFSFLF